MLRAEIQVLLTMMLVSHSGSVIFLRRGLWLVQLNHLNHPMARRETSTVGGGFRKCNRVHSKT